MFIIESICRRKVEDDTILMIKRDGNNITYLSTSGNIHGKLRSKTQLPKNPWKAMKLISRLHPLDFKVKKYKKEILITPLEPAKFIGKNGRTLKALSEYLGYTINVINPVHVIINDGISTITNNMITNPITKKDLIEIISVKEVAGIKIIEGVISPWRVR